MDIHIDLMQEEVNSLLSGKEISVFEDGTTTIFIKLPQTKETAQMIDILDRYNNEVYWSEEIDENSLLSDSDFE